MPLQTRFAITAAAFAHTAVRGAACSLHASLCGSANGIPVHPIGLSVATFKTPPANAQPWIGVTGYSATSGWSSLRHLEIIAAGGLPYFVDLCAPPPRPRPHSPFIF